MNATSEKYAIHAAAREGKSQYGLILAVGHFHNDTAADHKSTVSVFESLLNANPKSAYTKDDDERLPLHWAVSYNHKAIVDVLAQLKDFDPDAQDGLGWTPVMMSSSRKEGDAILTLLLSKGADPNITNTASQTALHFAASKANLDVARLLIAHKATTRTKDRRGQVPLHRAAAVGSVPMLKLLLENRSPVNGQDVDGMTPLHHACSEGHGDAAVFLLKEGAESDKKDHDGRFAIDLTPDEKVRKFILESAEREGIDVTRA